MNEKRFGNVLQLFALAGILLLGLCADALAEGAATYYVLNRDGTVQAYVLGDNNENAQAYNFGGEFQMTLAMDLETAIHYVPDNYGTVQSCIDAAADGDICRVRPGVYHENIVLNNKTVTIESTDGPAATILDGACAGSVVKLSGFYPAAAVLDGFTVTNGCASDSGGGISIKSITTTLRNCVITNNTAPSGGGIASNAAMVTIENCTISANVSTDPLKGGGGIYSYSDLMTTKHSILSGNTSTGNGGAVLIDTSTWIDNFAEHVDNIAGQFGGGVFCENCSYFVNADVIARNTADMGGGIYAAGGAPARVELVNSTLTGNHANEGGGFYSRADSDILIILNSIMYGNNTLPVFQYVNPCSSIAYSNIEGGFAGQGNINADPLFNNADIGDYHPQSQSPGFNTGTSSAVSSCAVLAPAARDMDGTPSPQGPAHDMGAYEYIPAITVSTEPHGTISPSGKVVVTYGTDRTFTIAPDAGYHVADVLVDGVSAGAATTYTISNVTANHTISASFAQDMQALEVTKAGTGSGAVTSSPAGINCGGTCSAVFNAGTLVTLTAAPAADSLFAGWGGACSGTASCVVTMDAAKSVTATFNQYITLTVPNGGESWNRVNTYAIQWNYAGNPGPYVKIELWKGGVLDRIITSSTSLGSNGNGSYSWKITGNQTFGPDYRIRITSTSNSNYVDASNENFTMNK